MGLFGKKNKVEAPPVEEIPPLPTLDTLHEQHQEPQQKTPQPPMKSTPISLSQPPRLLPPIQKQPTPQPQEPMVKEERPAYAPLFVKIDRYRNVLNALGQLKTSVIMIRNSFSTLNELEKARYETLKLIEDAVGKLESKLSALDAELLRPAGQHMEASPEYQDVQTVHATVADLKGQIEQLKSELDHMA